MLYKILSQAALAMTLISASALARAASIQAVADCFQTGSGPEDLHITNSPGPVTAGLDNSCTSSAYADWSVLRVGGFSSLANQESRSTAMWTIYFALNDPILPPDYQESVVFQINYDATLTAIPETGSYTTFQVVVNNDPYTIPVNLGSAYDAYANNNCPSPDPNNLPRCDGHFTGTASYRTGITLNRDPGYYNRLIITAQTTVTNGSVDAMHSVSFGAFDLAPTTTFAYDDPTIGNPLNFTSAAPEPTSILLALAGLSAISARTLFVRRKAGSRKTQ